MTEPPLKIYEKLDPELLKHVENSGEFVFNDGALPKKFKLLIAMAFDASFGAVNGVKSQTDEAMKIWRRMFKPHSPTFPYLSILIKTNYRFTYTTL